MIILEQMIYKSKEIFMAQRLAQWLFSLENISNINAFQLTISYAVIVFSIIIVSFLSYYITKRIIHVRLKRFIEKTTFTWDDILLKYKVFHRLFLLAPAVVVYLTAHFFPEAVSLWIQRLMLAYIIAVSILVIDSLLNAGVQIYRTFEVSKQKPIRGYIQILQIAVYIVGGIMIIATLINKSPWGIFAGLGAISAVLLLVFKDTIMGLVASFQLMSNNMIHIGDWIEMPKYGADGDVIEITLHTVKVRNWDKTITTIPTYALISDAFKNWRGMSESGGRRIKRSISIDMNTVKFCTPEMIERFEKIDIIKDYIKTKKDEVAKYNADKSLAEGDISGRLLTNLGTFRAFIQNYLENNSNIHKEMTLLVRHLAPTENGLPIEIYVFSSDKVWANYEGIQADIFDHIIASAQTFDLRVYQYPSGSDVQEVLKGAKANI